MSNLEKQVFQQTPTTQENLDNKLEKELFLARTEELNEAEQKLQWETKEKKDLLNKEYVSYAIWKYIVLSTISLGNNISYSIEWKEISINWKSDQLPIELTQQDIIQWIEKYLQQNYFQEKFNKNNIVEYTLESLTRDNFSPEQIKEITNNSSELLNYLESKLWWNSRAIFSMIWENFLLNVWLWVQAIGYARTNNTQFLTNKWWFNDWVEWLVWEEYSKNFENANPLLKTAVIWWGSIYAAVKLFQWINEKVSGKDGIGWFNLIFGWAAVELIGQVVTWKSITWNALKTVWELFKWSDNSNELKKQLTLLEKNDQKIELGEYRALTHLIIGKSDIEWILTIDHIKKNANKEMVDFFCNQNNISKDDLYKNVLTGHENILKDISSETGVNISQLNFSEINFHQSEKTYSEKVLTLQARSNDIKNLSEKLINDWSKDKTIKKTYKEQFTNYLISGNETELSGID